MSISIDANDGFCSYLLTQNYDTIAPSLRALDQRSGKIGEWREWGGEAQ